MDDLQKIAEAACRAGLEAGAEFCDASAGRAETIDIELEHSEIKSCNAHTSQRVTVRCFVRGGRGMAVAHGFEQALECARSAALMAEAADADDDFVSLPAPGEYPEVGGLYSARVAAIDPAKSVELARAAVASGKGRAPDANIAGAFSASRAEGALANSLGISVGQESTSVSCDIQCVLRRGEEQSSFSEFHISRDLDEGEVVSVGGKAVERADRYLGAQTIGTGRMTVVLGPLSAASLFGTLARAANAEHIQRKRSFFTGRLGTKVCPQFVTILDDGLVPGGMSSSPFDGEGHPRRRVEIIRDGRLEKLLHNSYTAHKAGTESTGHGSQGGSISPTNLRPALGRRTGAEIIASIDRGLYIEAGSFSPDLSTGRLSAMLDYGLMIENGELTHAVSNAMVASHVFDILDNIVEISSDYRDEAGTIMPTVVVEGISVSGQ